MGKKKKKSFYRKQLRPFVRNNNAVLAALGGAAAGIALTALLGTEKAKQILRTVEDSMANFTTKVRDGWDRLVEHEDDDIAVTNHKRAKTISS